MENSRHIEDIYGYVNQNYNMEHIDVNTMIAVVQEYILKVKGVHVKIELRYHPFVIQRDVDMLHWCYNVALDYDK